MATPEKRFSLEPSPADEYVQFTYAMLHRPGARMAVHGFTPKLYYAPIGGRPHVFDFNYALPVESLRAVTGLHVPYLARELDAHTQAWRTIDGGMRIRHDGAGHSVESKLSRKEYRTLRALLRHDT